MWHLNRHLRPKQSFSLSLALLLPLHNLACGAHSECMIDLCQHMQAKIVEVFNVHSPRQSVSFVFKVCHFP